MASLTDLLPREVPASDADPRVVSVEDDEADEVLEVLSSDTRRDIYRRLFEEPATSSELAEELDTTVQNISHHVSALQEAQLIEQIGELYSEKGNEMAVYGPASDPLVFVGQTEMQSRIDSSIGDLVAGLGILAGASLLVQWGVYQLFAPDRGELTAIDPASYAGTVEETGGLLVWLVFEAGEPGMIFFFGCLFVVGLASLALR
jgi:DNA-binding transcriptional ArsR family regulator